MRAPVWAVFISGRGSNLAALLELREEVDLRLVVSSSSEAYGLARAKRAGIPTMLTPLQPLLKDGQPTDRMKIDWPRLSSDLQARGITHVFLAGFMKIVPASFIGQWRGRIVNLHPSLLPAYPGLDSIERAFSDRNELGISVHEVIEDVDAGPMIYQRRTLSANAVTRYARSADFEFCEFLVHVDEQRLVKECIRRWKAGQIKTKTK